MPAYNTGFVENVIVSGSRRYNQILVLLTNTGTTSGSAFLEGLYTATGVNQHFASEGFNLVSQSNAIRTFSVALVDFFDVQIIASIQGISMEVFGISSTGQYTTLPVQELPVRRITADYREDITLTGDDFAALSFRRRSAFTRPRQYAAALLPQSIEILATRPIRYKLVLGGTVDGTYSLFPTPTTQLSETETALTVNYTCTTVTGGEVVYQGQGAGLSGAYTNIPEDLLANRLLKPLPPDTAITLVVSSLTGTDKVAVTFRMEEQW